MRFSTVMPLLLAAGFANAQFGKGNGKGGNNAANNAGNNAGNANANAGNNGQNAANGQNNNGGNNAGSASASCLNPNVVSSNANTDGLAQAEAGQAASATDANNFINFCAGKTITNGLQVKGGSCNPIPMGNIPATSKMISAVMVSPQDGDTVPANTAMTFSVKIANLVAGTFTNPDTTYYVAPQDLKGGSVVGHTHISVQDIGNAKTTTPPDANTFAFFKGINDAGDGQGTLSANLTAGLPAGNYRVCSMTSAANHQPVLMPVAQRGPQDDCVRFTVANGGGGNNGGKNGANNAGNANANAGNANANAGGNGQNAANGQAAQQAQQAQGQAGKGGAGGKGGKGKGRPKFAARDFVA